MSIEARLHTYQNWEGAANAQHVQDLAEAGFSYRETDDKTVCFYCGVTPIVAQHDDPWIAHAQGNPHCDFVWERKGHAFIKASLEIIERVDNGFEERRRKSMSAVETQSRAGGRGRTATTRRRPSLPPMRGLLLDPDLSQGHEGEGHHIRIPETAREYALHSEDEFNSMARLTTRPIQADPDPMDKFKCRLCFRLFNASCVHPRGDFEGMDMNWGHLYCRSCCTGDVYPRCHVMERQDVYWADFDDVSRDRNTAIGLSETSE